MSVIDFCAAAPIFVQAVIFVQSLDFGEFYEGGVVRDRIFVGSLLSFCFLVMAGPLRAGTITELTLFPSAAASGNVVGNTTTSAPGFGAQSWQASATTSGQKSEVYIAMSSLFSGPVTIGDVASVSYWTNIPGTSSSPNWTFYFYTAPTLSGDEGSFYHSRLNSEPYLTGTSSASAPPDAWHQWSTNDPSNPMRFYDAGRDGGVFGTFSDPTLANLQAGSINWPTSGNSVNYAGEDINLVSLQTGTAWAPGFTGLLDGLTITLNNGDVGEVNFEAVPAPLPSSAWGGLALLVGFGLFKLRRNAASPQ